ncbi:MAG: GNAT family N-acetyltransferase [Actinobacteria bacterium]|nr:GNAT family N-acetyltransferase [Actinomycetota bacterium]
MEIQRVHYLDADTIEQAAEVFNANGKRFCGDQQNLWQVAQDYVLLVARNESEIHGAIVCGWLTHREADTEYNPYLLRPLDDLYPDWRVGQLMDMAVLSRYRHFGVGTELAVIAVELLINNRARRIVAASRFRSAEQDSSLGILARLGFQILTEVPKYYTYTKDFRCPDCGDGGLCACSAILMLREVTL